jgi:hypothetical protein
MNILINLKNEKARKQCVCGLHTSFELFSSGERGIRTPGPVTVNGFQDRRIRPLCHLSGAKIGDETIPKKLSEKINVTTAIK